MAEQNELQERVETLEYIVGVLVEQIGDLEVRAPQPPANDFRTRRFFRRAPSKLEVRSDVENLLNRLGMSDVEFRVM